LEKSQIQQIKLKFENAGFKIKIGGWKGLKPTHTFSVVRLYHDKLLGLTTKKALK
jgi:hypothetical protein